MSNLNFVWQDLEKERLTLVNSNTNVLYNAVQILLCKIEDLEYEQRNIKYQLELLRKK